MYRQRQFADLSQIEEYATAASGELATALVLAARVDGVVTVEDATTFASQNSASEAKLLQEELYFRWISERITDIKKKLKE